MDETARRLRYVHHTEAHTCMSLPGTGGAGMEAAMANLIQRGDTAVICINGLFGVRMAEIAGRCGAKVVKVEAPWGKPVDPNDLRRAVRGLRPRIISAVHGETSTGVEQPMDDIAAIAHECGAMLIVDSVATLGGMPVEPDRWGAAICYSASQKCLSSPPGLATVWVSDEAMTYIRGREAKVASWYLDLDLHDRYWFAEERAYHHTAPVLLVYALHAALGLIATEGLEQRFARHAMHQEATAAGLEALGLELFADAKYRLPTVLSVVPPEGINEAKVRTELLNEFGIEIAGGLGAYIGKMWRIGIMGHSANEQNLGAMLDALETLMARQGYGTPRGAAVSAAQRVYNAHAVAPNA
jgi:alanine-glyoxylate transaminase/serine-glyoxylate transaminase/serine-pyruvate transaminase